MTHRDTRTQLQDVNLADVVSTAQAAAGDGADGLPTTWCGAETGGDNAAVTPVDQGAVQGRLCLRRRPAGPLRGLEGRAAGQRRDRPAVPLRPGRRHQGHPLRHGHQLRPAVRGHPDRPAPGRARRLRRQLHRDLHRRAARPRRRRRPARRGRPRRRALGLRAGVRPGRDRHGPDGRARGQRERPQPRRPDVDPLQPLRRGRSRRRSLGLVAGRLPARDDAQPGRRPVGRAALDAAGRRHLAAVRPLLAGRGRHVLRRGRRRRPRDAAGLRRAAGRHPAELRLRPRRLLQPGARRGLLPRDALEHVRLGVPGRLRRGRAGLRRRLAVGA